MGGWGGGVRGWEGVQAVLKMIKRGRSVRKGLGGEGMRGSGGAAGAIGDGQRSTAAAVGDRLAPGRAQQAAAGVGYGSHVRLGRREGHSC